MTPINRRHAECEDCHNPHLARADELFPDPAKPSNTVLGASRVIPLFGFAGTPPTYTFVAGQDTVSGPPTESQLCYKCHSSWTTQPSGQTDLARVLNPANPSFHPVEDRGRTRASRRRRSSPAGARCRAQPAATATATTSTPTAGPHGSNYRYILKRPYEPSPARRADERRTISASAATPGTCTRIPSSPEAVRAASRFNKPGVDKGHAEHVGEKQVPCGACHVTHGSATLPAPDGHRSDARSHRLHRDARPAGPARRRATAPSRTR